MTADPAQGHGETGIYPRKYRVQGEGHPGWDDSLSQDVHTHTRIHEHAHTHMHAHVTHTHT